MEYEDKENKGKGTGGEREKGEGEMNTEENKKNGPEKIQRITVSKEAQNVLERIKERVNDGFIGGRINLTQMANWILMRFHAELDDTQIKEIRAEHFDEVTMLENVLKLSKESGKVPSDFKALLQKQFSLEEPTKRKTKVALT